MKKILVSTISFVNHQKEGSEIYTTFAKRLVNDVLTKTNYDVRVSTNEPKYFEELIGNDRVIINHCELGNHKTNVKAFNQLLKFYALKDVRNEYDWILYLDCDAGLTTKQAASPYIQSMASILEIDPNAVNLNDPTITKALTAVNEQGAPAVVPLWQFERDLKKDERYKYTKNAQNEYIGTGYDVLRTLGFEA